jgi:DNA-binding beta-propeller fold protein YncE
VTLPNNYQVAVVDLKTLQVVRLIPVPKGPHTVLIPPGQQIAYIACMKSGFVAAINLSDWSVRGLIKVGNNADGIGWASFQQGS